MNEQNLIPQNQRTESERRKIAQMGGIASGEARKQKATMKKVLQSMLEEIPKIDNEEKLTYKELITLGLMKGAITGNATNYRTILETIGEISSQIETKEPTININMINNENLQEGFFKKEEE